MLFHSNKGIYTAHRSEGNEKYGKQANLLMIVGGEYRHCTAMKNTSRLLKPLNATLNGFHTAPGKGKHYKYISSNGHVKVKMHYVNEKWLKFHVGQYSKVLVMLCTGFDSILRPVDEQCREKLNEIRTERKGKHRAQKRKTHIYLQDVVYTARLLMEIFLIP